MSLLRWLLAPAGCSLLLGIVGCEAISVELSEILPIEEAYATGEHAGLSASFIEDFYGGKDPIDGDCAVGKCVGLLTRDGSLELDSRYGCTPPYAGFCGVDFALSADFVDKSILGGVKIALHPDSMSKLRVLVDGATILEEWDAVPGSSELQEIPGLEGLEGGRLSIEGVQDAGDYLAILEVEIYVVVDEVEPLGVSASTRASVSATATTNNAWATLTLDGDATDGSAWACPSAEGACEITYDLQAVESLQQLRIAFSNDADAGGKLNVLAAGESGVFSYVRSGLEAGGRPLGSDGLQTFGGVLALARYVKIEAVPSGDGGAIVINEVELRVGDAPVRPVSANGWLQPTGMLPLAADTGSSGHPNYDIREPSAGGCDSPAHFEGCHVYYIKDGDMSDDSRWTCGPLAAGNFVSNNEDCHLMLSLNYFRYVRQIQFAFHMGDEQYNEFSIEANTVDKGWVTVVSSAISSGDSTDYQTFDVAVHTNEIRLVPVFQRVDQWIGIKEMVILETENMGFVEGTLPVFDYSYWFPRGDDGDDDDGSGDAGEDVPTRFEFHMPRSEDYFRFRVPPSTVTAVKLRFPSERLFVFTVSYDDVETGEEIVEEFISDGGPNTMETFTLSAPADVESFVYITAVSGPTFESQPDYPTLRVLDFQIVGEIKKDPGHFEVVTTTMTVWRVVPDIIGDGVSEQKEIMTAICEAKGAAFDGTDCVGELDDSSVHISMKNGNYFLDGPLFLKSGVTLSGGDYSYDEPSRTYLVLHNHTSLEDAVIVIDGVTGGEVDSVYIEHKTSMTGDITPGTLGNLCVDVRDSQDLKLAEIDCHQARTGAARFVDSKNISVSVIREGEYETGNFMELAGVDDFHFEGIPEVAGLRIEDSSKVVLQGGAVNVYEVPTPVFLPPTGGDQTASIVITGASSGIVFQDCSIYAGGDTAPVLMESTEPLTLDNVLGYEEAESGDCIVEVPTESADDLIVQLNSYEILSKDGNCWVWD